MEDGCIFIADKTVINYLLSGDHEKIEAAQIFLDYISWRKYHKKIYMTPTTFRKIKEKLMGETDDSLVAYFENWFENGIELIGEDSTSDEEDIISLFETLEQISPVVFLISDEMDPEGVNTMDMEKLNTYLKDKKDFYKHLFEVYYDSSGI